MHLLRSPAPTLLKSTASVAWMVFAGALAATALGPIVVGTYADTKPTSRQRELIPRERPGDPPGRAARPTPGALPSTPVRMQAFVSIQANVDAGGANILGDAANEPSIAVDPTFPNRIAIGWRQFDTVASNFRQAGWAYSRDGGRTWSFPGVLDPGVFRSDPVLDADAEGNFYYNSLKVIGNDFSCQVFRSTNGGIAWGPPVLAFGGDKQWMTIDRTGGMGHGHIYCAWSIAAGCCGNDTFNRSTNGGFGFEVPVAMPLTPIWGTLAVSPDGTLYVSGVDPDNYSNFIVAKSTNARDSGASPGFTSTTFGIGGQIFVGLSNSPNPGGLLGQVWIAVDRSAGPTAGYIYLLCTVGPPGVDIMDVHFVRSTDGGLTWSSPVRVNDDPLSATSWQWFGTMSVAPNGRIDAVWADTRNSGLANVSELYYSFSMNGGVSWAANQKLTPAWNSWAGWPNQNKIGDYYDMVSDDVGAHLAFAATFNNEQDVYYLRIGDYDCNMNGIGDAEDIAQQTSPDVNQNGIPDECELSPSGIADGDVLSFRLRQNVPNPFNPVTTIGFEVPSGGGHVRLQIFDVTGRIVRTLVSGFKAAGPHTVDWNGLDNAGNAVSSGLYFYRLDGRGFSETRKMVLLR